MKPYQEIEYKGRKVIILDISNSTPEEAIAYFQDAHPRIALFPPKSALILTDASNARFNAESTAAIKEFVARNSPYVKASASVGTEGLRKLIHYAIERYAGRNIQLFENRQEALEWLVSQG